MSDGEILFWNESKHLHELDHMQRYYRSRNQRRFYDNGSSMRFSRKSFTIGGCPVPGRFAIAGRKLAITGRKLAILGRKLAIAGRKLAIAGRKLAITGRKLAINSRQCFNHRCIQSIKRCQ
jgi:hypothetical protein